MCYIRPLSYKNKCLVITFLDHPVLGAVQNNSAIGSSPDPLSLRDGLACETNVDMGVTPHLGVLTWSVITCYMLVLLLLGSTMGVL